MPEPKAASTADAAFEEYAGPMPESSSRDRQQWDAELKAWNASCEHYLERAAEVIRTAQIRWSAEQHGDIKTQFVEEVLKLKEGGDA